MLYASFPCACALHAMTLFVVPCAIVALLSLYLSFLSFGLLVRIQSRPMVFVIVHTPWPISKGLDHLDFHVFACLLLCFMLVLASLVLGFAMFDALHGLDFIWLHLMPMRHFSGVIT